MRLRPELDGLRSRYHLRCILRANGHDHHEQFGVAAQDAPPPALWIREKAASETSYGP